MMNVYIHTRGRAGKIPTLEWLPRKILGDVFLVVRHDEVNEYREHHIENYCILPKHINGLSATRQWILENAQGRYIAMLDDDLTRVNFKPQPDYFGGLRKATEKEIEKCFTTMQSWLENEIITLASFTDRMSSARPSSKMYYENGRVSQVFVMDRKIILNNKCRFDRVELAQDADMVLQLMKKGLRNRVWTRYSFNARGEDSAGGCSIYRNEELRKKVYAKMEKLHPGIVTTHWREKFGRDYIHLKIRYSVAKKIGGFT